MTKTNETASKALVRRTILASIRSGKACELSAAALLGAGARKRDVKRELSRRSSSWMVSGGELEPSEHMEYSGITESGKRWKVITTFSLEKRDVALDTCDIHR